MLRVLISTLFCSAFSVPFFFLFVAIGSFLTGVIVLFFSWELWLLKEALNILLNGGWFFVFMSVFGTIGLWGASQLFCRMWNHTLRISPPKTLLTYIGMGCIALIAFFFVFGRELPLLLVISSASSIPVTVMLMFINRGYFANHH